MIRLFIAVVILLPLGAIAATWWPETTTNSMSWSNTVGVVGGIPSVTTISTTLSAGSSAATINSALSACASNQVVKLSEGTYNLSAVIILAKDGVVLRGSGSNTVLVSQGGGSSAIYLGGSQTITADASISSGATYGSTSIVVSSSANLNVGGQIFFRANGATNLDWKLSGSAPPITTRGHAARVLTISGTTITFWPPCEYNFMTTEAGAGSPTVWRIPFNDTYRRIGLEDLTLVLDDAASSTDGIYVVSAYDSWVSGVTTVRPANRHYQFVYDVNCTARSNWLADIQGHAANTLGLGIEESTSFCLFEDNILQACNVVCENGYQVGNVVAYNFVTDAYQTSGGSPSQYAGIWLGHSFHTYKFLAEGNFANTVLFTDGQHGSGSHNLAFRNFLHGWSPVARETNGNCVMAARWGEYNQAFWNVLGTSNYPGGMSYQPTNSGSANGAIYFLGYYSSGNATITNAAPPVFLPNPGDNPQFVMDTKTTNHFVRHHNFDHNTFTTIDDGVSSTDGPASLYLQLKPAWMGSLPWPLIGPDVSIASEGATNSARVEITNPARERFYGRSVFTVSGTTPSRTGTGRAMKGRSR